jgi:hypothetical protein
MTLLAEIEQFLMVTGMPATRFGVLAFGNPAFVAEVRNGRVCREFVTARARKFMAENQDWKPKPPKKKRIDDRRSPHPGQTQVRKTEKDREAIVLDRTPCFNCGVRADIGCHHQPKSEPVRIA